MIETANRLDRRKARTRAALIGAARQLLAHDGGADSSIQEITELADVGFGSFYNHFATKAALFDTAVAETLEEHGALLDQITAGLDDPAEVFASGVRLTVRLQRTHPQIARIISNTGSNYLTSGSGLAPRALRDITAAHAAGRFDIADPAIALACTGGALLGVLDLVKRKPKLQIDRVADELAINLLRMFGLTGDEAREIASRPLPVPKPRRS
ncbi:AcrR family transcriptional regulator [Nakamurella sp. UYEF19]|uniref:TetR/AcrR family transcriptional regulator n=1 Tax=Nakamurella sp. UYEF19 TaxID=1756392 RepID=UPI003397AAA8